MFKVAIIPPLFLHSGPVTFQVKPQQSRHQPSGAKGVVLVREGPQDSANGQNVTPRWTWYARGVTKCVPEKVDRKLYRPSLFATFRTLNRSLTFALVPPNRLSLPNPRSTMCLGATRGGLFTSSSAPSAGITSLVAPRFDDEQLPIGESGVCRPL